MSQRFCDKIIKWHTQHGRKNLPWQKNINPYRVWVSEVMLQQTQVSTVVPYYKNFIKRFPTIKSLATSDIDEVLHLWTGLGYYARGRNLHKTAIIIHDKSNGRFPKDLESLINLPGIGRSTAGAILSIAYNNPHPILDGNVKRVISRYYTISGWPGDTEVAKTLWQLAEKNTPQNNVAQYTQAIMDIGATICTRTNPKCNVCPVAKNCIAQAEESQTQYPGKKPKKQLPIKQTRFLIIQNDDDEILLTKRPPHGIWGGLWCFPECGLEEDINEWLTKERYTKITERKSLSPFRHTFSHYHLDIHPEHICLAQMPARVMDTDSVIWYKPCGSNKLGLSAPVKKCLEQFSAKN